jgi:uncharacterized membrane protein YkoI
MNRRVLKFAVAGAIVAALALGGAAWAVAGGGDDDEGSVTGPNAERAKAAALAHVGGTANAVERDSEDGATWEVEVTKANGETVDVRLDASFRVVTVEGDSESPDDDD